MMKQNFCDDTILFTKKFVMSPVEVESSLLSDGATGRPRRILKFIKPDTLSLFLLFFKSLLLLFIGMWHLFLIAFVEAFSGGNELNVKQQ